MVCDKKNSRCEVNGEKDVREEIESEAWSVGKIVKTNKSLMKWAGRMARMKDDKLPKND